MAQLQLVVWGATGFVGKLVCEHITRDYQGKVSWAMAARSKERLEAVKKEMTRVDQRAQNVPILIGDANDQASVDNVVKQARVVLACAGPYAKYGTPVVDACVRLGVHYCDLTGEVAWVKRMADVYHEEAARKGVKIVPSCGFDSIPSDLGTLLVVTHMKEKLHRDCAAVELLIEDMKGSVSGGTLASGVESLKEAAAGKKAAADPYGLNPPGAPRGPDTADYWGITYSKHAKMWTSPFVMQIVNTRVVRKSNALLDQWYGSNFSYTEKTAAKSLPQALAGAMLMAAVGVVFFVPFLRAIALRFLPKPGEGPSKETQVNGYWNARVVGITEGHPAQSVWAHLGGKRDPGYFDTARMLLEAGLCLAFKEDETPGPKSLKGGVLTPASAMGMPLIRRLNAAGITFRLEHAAGRPIAAEE